MTCVIGYKTDAGIWIGADSAGTNEYGQQTLRADTKVFRRHGKTFGFCGSFRMGQLLRFGLDKIEQPVGMSDFEYMVTKFVDDVRYTLRCGGYTHIKDNEETGGDFVVAYRDQLYEVESDFQVSLSTREYVCIGSGSDVASGAMHVLGVDQPPTSTIKRALRAAAEHDAFVSAPFVVVRHKP